MYQNSNFTKKEIWNQCSDLYKQHLESFLYGTLLINQESREQVTYKRNQTHNSQLYKI